MTEKQGSNDTAKGDFIERVLSKEPIWSERIGRYNLKRILFIYTAALLLLLLTRCFNNNFWCDECLTIRLLDFDFATMLKEETLDMHPPLYHIIFYVTCKIFGCTPFVYHIVSYIPYVLAIILTLTVLRKRFGIKFAFIMVTFLSVLFTSFNFVQEVRMYEWGMLFVLCAFISAIELMKEKRNRDFVFFTISAVLCAYTHYYCLLTVSIMFLYLIIWAIKTKEKPTIIKTIGSAVAAILLYMPWIIYFVSIFFNVAIHGNTASTRIQLITHCVLSLFYNGAVVFFIFILVVLILYVLRKNDIIKFKPETEKKIDKTISFMNLNDLEWKWISLGMIVIFATILIPTVFSYIVQPIVEMRYFFPISAIAWFIVAFCASKCKASTVATVSVLAVTMLFAAPLCTFITVETINDDGKIQDVLDKTKPYMSDTDVICGSKSTALWTVFVHYYHGIEVQFITDDGKFPDIDSTRQYWVFISTPINDAMIQDLQSKGYTYELVVEKGNLGSYDVWVYKLVPMP